MATSRVGRDVQNSHYNDGIIQCVCWHLLTSPSLTNSERSSLGSLNADWIHILKILTAKTSLSKESEKLVRLVTLCVRIDTIEEEGHHMKILEDILWLLEVMRSYPDLQEADRQRLEELITETQCQIVINYHEYGYESKALQLLLVYFQGANMEDHPEKELLSQRLMQVLRHRFTSTDPYDLETASRFIEEYSRGGFCTKLREFVAHLVERRFSEPPIFTDFKRRALKDLIKESSDLLTIPSTQPESTSVSNTTAVPATAVNDDDREFDREQESSVRDSNELEHGGDNNIEEGDIFGESDDMADDGQEQRGDKSVSESSEDLAKDTVKRKKEKRNVKTLAIDESSGEEHVEWSEEGSDDDFQEVPRRTRSSRSGIEDRAKRLDDDRSSCSTPTKTLPDQLPRLQLNFRKEHLHHPKQTNQSQHRKLWEPAEERYLREGVKKYGEGQWKQILRSYPFSKYRTNIHLKDKWRNLKKACVV